MIKAAKLVMQPGEIFGMWCKKKKEKDIIKLKSVTWLEK